jgi:hypothetical protein
VYPLARLLYCQDCGKPLTADTERFRHPKPLCAGFTAAKPDAVRYGGESYRAELYDSIVPAILQHVAEGAAFLPDVMAHLERGETGPDADTLARVERERVAARRRLETDGDPFAFTETMARLSRDEADARAVRRDLPTAEQAQAYLADLPRLWNSASAEARKLLANALFERVDVLGVEHVWLTPTKEAREHGWLEAWANRELSVPLVSRLGCGRGERRQTSTTDPNVPFRLPLEIALTGVERAMGSAVA